MGEKKHTFLRALNFQGFQNYLYLCSTALRMRRINHGREDEAELRRVEWGGTHLD